MQYSSNDIQFHQDSLQLGENRELPPILLLEDQQIGQEGFAEKFTGLLAESLPTLKQQTSQLLLVRGCHPLFPVRRLVQLLHSLFLVIQLEIFMNWGNFKWVMKPYC